MAVATHAASSGTGTHPASIRTYDIVIVGAGPAGLMLSTCLAGWGYSVKHIDNRPEPTLTGRADGIQPRSLDLLRNMDLKADIMARKPARVYEVAFWGPSESGHSIVRTETWASCPSFIDARYPFTTRPWKIRDFHVAESEDPDYPVHVHLEHVDKCPTETVRAKYLFGGDGARSFIRQRLQIGFQHRDPVEHVWGVMDGVVRTDFPDIKMKCTIHSQHGSIMVIPREDGMVRLYVQLGSSTDANWDPRRRITEEQAQESAKRILKPYSIDWRRIEWFSVYPIGQGISKHYTLDQRVFLGGDACHTHSPKAGQGMNTAFSDALNLAWKIHAVEGGFASRSLLETYQSERKRTAESLLDFDSRYAKLFSQPPLARDKARPASTDENDQHDFVKTFKDSCRLTSGYGVLYEPNVLNWSASHPAQSVSIHREATRLVPGAIFINADVTRVVDANIVHLEQEIPMNGSFRIYVFAGDPGSTQGALRDFAKSLGHKRSFYAAYARSDRDRPSSDVMHNPHSRFYTLCTILAVRRDRVDISRDVPEVLARYRDHIYADDVWDHRVPDATAAAHFKMGLDEAKGGVVVVRPDGHVGVVASLVEGSGSVDALDDYFSAFCTKKLGGFAPQL